MEETKIKKRLNIKTRILILNIIFFIVLVGIQVFTLFVLKHFDRKTMSSYETKIRENYDIRIKEEVQGAVSMLDSVNQWAKANGKSDVEAKKIAADILREMRYGEEGYFWADDYEGNNIVLLGSKTEGTNRIGTKDGNGYEMVRDIIKVGMSNDGAGGYTDYVFPKAGETENTPKRSFSMSYKPWGWVIGTGAYTDFIDRDISAQQKMINTISLDANIKLVIFTVVALIISLVIAIIISVSITKPLRLLEVESEKMSEERYEEAEINFFTSDEIGRIAMYNSKVVERLKEMMKYIEEISENLIKLGEGDLNISYKYSYSGRFLPVKEAFEKTTQMLKDTLFKLSEASTQINAGTESLSSGTQSLAQSATEQSRSIEELNTSIDALDEHLKNTLKITREVYNSSKENSEAATKMSGNMNSLTDAMNLIKDKSGEISKINKTIEDIAFQTNILALNAAVEAARAGAAGKGFAVVADEVRNLATKSSDAAKNTTQLIEETVYAINAGAKSVSDTVEYMDSIVNASNKVQADVSTTLISIEAQAEESDRIKVNVGSIASVVQSSAATTEECAASSEELDGQAETLRAMMNGFKF